MSCLLRALGVSAVISATLFAASEHAKAQTSRSLVLQNIDDGKLVRLGGNTRPEANLANDRGVAAGDFRMEHMLLLLSRPAEQEQALRTFLDQQQDPRSPNHHA